MRFRPSDELTNTEFRIGVCRKCSAYGQISQSTKHCAVVDPPWSDPKMIPDWWFARIRACDRRYNRKVEGRRA